MDLANLPIIDREMGLKLAGNKEDLAQDLLDFFIRTLPEEFEAIQAAHDAQDSATLLKRVHKLHGAVCYCGLPRLKTLLARLETDLKNNIMINSSSHLEQLTKEIELLLEYHARPTPIGLK